MILPYFGSTRHSLNSAEKEMELSRFPTENISPYPSYLDYTIQIWPNPNFPFNSNFPYVRARIFHIIRI